MNDEREPRSDEGVRIIGAAEAGAGRRTATSRPSRPPAAAPAPASDVVWADDAAWDDVLGDQTDGSGWSAGPAERGRVTDPVIGSSVVRVSRRDAINDDDDWMDTDTAELRGDEDLFEDLGLTPIGRSDRAEGVRSEGVRSEGVRSEGGRSEGVRSEGGRSEGGRSDTVRVDTVRGEPVQAETVRRMSISGDDPGETVRGDTVRGDTVRGDTVRSGTVRRIPAGTDEPERGTRARRNAAAGVAVPPVPRAPIRIESSIMDDDVEELPDVVAASAARRRPAGARSARTGFETLGARVMTGLGLIAAAVGSALIDDRGRGMLVLIAIVVGLCAVEFLRVFRSKSLEPAIPVVAVGAVALVFAAYWRGPWGQSVVLALGVITTILWFLANAGRGRSTSSMAVTLLALAYVGFLPSYGGLLLAGSVMDRTHGVEMLLFPVLCTVAHDTFGYFSGKLVGRTKLAPTISPNKTVEGLVGGLLGVIGAAWLLSAVLDGPWSDRSLLVKLSLALPVMVMAPLGDLCESLVKRDLGVKDMGTFLPGHGGLFDRFDGMMFTLPAFAFAMHAYRWLPV